MAETEGTCSFTRLELSDGDYVYLRSIWQTTNFSVVVYDGFQAWSHSVSTKEVGRIAREWKIDVGDFMRSMRVRLTRQHPTCSYSMSFEKNADVVNVWFSFTIDDLWEQEELDFKLRMEGVSDVRPVICSMLDYLADTIDKLKEQLVELETQGRQVPAASEPEPNISLSLARKNPRRQSSSFLEPRVRDISKFKQLEDRDPNPNPGRRRPYGQQQLLYDTPRNSSTGSFDQGTTKATPDFTLETEREVSYFRNRGGATHGGRIVRNKDLTVKMVSLTSHIMRLLDSLGVRDEELVMGAGDERGLKITEMRNPRREEQPQRSLMFEKNSVRAPSVSVQTFQHNTMTLARRHSNAGTKSNEEPEQELEREPEREPERNQVKSTERSQEKSKNAAEVEPKDGGSDEEWTSKATLDSILGRDSNSRVKAELPEKTIEFFPRGQRLNEANSSGEKRVKCQDPQNTTSVTELQNGASRRQESPAKATTGKKSSELRWDKDADLTTPSATKREKVTQSHTEEDEETEKDEEEEEHNLREEEGMPEYVCQKSTGSRSPRVDHRGRKRSVEDREDDSKNKGSGRVKFEQLEDLDLDEGTKVKAKRTRKPNKKFFSDDMQTSAGNDKKRDSSIEKSKQVRTLASMFSKKSNGDKAKAAFRPPEKKHRRSERDEAPENVLVTDVPDSDFYNFDKDRVEALVKADQIWAVYADNDEMPRSYARIRKVFSAPKFAASITWLTPHQPSEEAKQRSQSSGYAISCGEFEDGEESTLTEINCFSHKMEVGWLSTKVMTIYPREGEVWALFNTVIDKQQENFTTTSRASGFRLAVITEDVQAGTQPEIMVLGRVTGFRTIWKERYVRGRLPTTDHLTRFSHRVPAYQLRPGHELNGIILKNGGWDIDPAGVPPEDDI